MEIEDNKDMYFDLLHDCKINGLDTQLLYALDCVKCGNLKDEYCNNDIIFDIAKLVNRVWLDSDIDLSISRVADVIVDNYDEIQEKNMSTDDIVDEYYDIICNH